MTAWTQRVRNRAVVVPAVVVLVLAVAGIVLAVVNRSGSVRTVERMVTGTPEGSTAVRLDTTLYLPSVDGPAPAVLLAQGFGGDKTDLDATARTLAEHGYAALAYTARGFGDSGGDIHLDNPHYEVHDAELLVDYLSTQPQVDRSKIAVAGSSYGGALSLLLAGYDTRIKAVAADITWNDLQHALFPNAAGSAPGVLKKLWVGTLFGNGFATPSESTAGLRDAIAHLSDGTAARGTISCGRFAPSLCSAYQDAARTGSPNSSLRAMMRASSPATILRRITAPTLLTRASRTRCSR